MAVQQNREIATRMHQALMGVNTRKWIGEAIPATMRKYLTPERMARVVLSTIKRTPGLWACTPESIVRSVIDAASLGLEPVGGPLAHGYLVPYKDECQFIISYQGLIELARRSGEFQTLEANVVYEKDRFVLRYGFDADFVHEPYIGTEPRGEVLGAYCMAKFSNDERHVTWMSVLDIEKRKLASTPGSRGKGPWEDWYEEMCVKTVIKKAAKLWPKTQDIGRALDMENGVRSEVATKVLDAQLEPEPEPPRAVPPERKPSRSEKLAQKILKPKPDEQPTPEEEEEMPWEKQEYQEEANEED